MSYDTIGAISKLLAEFPTEISQVKTRLQQIEREAKNSLGATTAAVYGSRHSSRTSLYDYYQKLTWCNIS